MRAFFTNKLAWLLVLLHTVLFGIGMYQRNGMFHFYYEPLTLQIIIVIDFLWLFLADWVGLGNPNEPFSGLVFMGIGASLQWFIVGHLIGKIVGQTRD